jgi:hypothetical protein
VLRIASYCLGAGVLTMLIGWWFWDDANDRDRRFGRGILIVGAAVTTTRGVRSRARAERRLVMSGTPLQCPSARK